MPKFCDRFRILPLLIAVGVAGCDLPDGTSTTGSTSVSSKSTSSTTSSSAISASYSTITGTDNVPADGLSTSTITITLKNGAGTGVSGILPQFTATNTGFTNVYGPCGVTDSSGVSTCLLASSHAEAKALAISSPITRIGGTVNFTAGAASLVAFTTQPPDSVAGATFSPAPVVKITDSNGVTVTTGADATASVALSILSGTGSLAGTVSMAAVAGIANFASAGLSINLVGSKVLRATKAATVDSGTLTVDSHTVTISAGAVSAANSTITGSGPVAADGAATSTVTITLRDAGNNAVSGQTPTFSATDTGGNNSYGTCSAGNASGVSTCVLSSGHAEVKTLSIATPVSQAGGAVTFTSGGLNLVSPIELVDLPLSSSTTPTTFARTRTSLDTGDYNGTVSYFFELVGQSVDPTSRAVTLVDAAAGTVATITLTSSDTTPTRIRVPFTPTTGASNYRVTIAGTTANNQLQVYAARILVKQVGATKTRLYIPLLAGDQTNANAVDLTGVDSTTSTSYTQGTSTYYSIWRKNAAALADLAAGNPWTFEAVLFSSNSSGTPGAALYNKTLNSAVAGASVSTSGTAATLASVAFADSALGDGQDYEVRINTNSPYTTSIARAGLWVKLTNLTQGEAFFRTGRAAVAAATTIYDHDRQLIDTSVFSSPSVYFESTGSNSVGGGGNTELLEHGANDVGSSGTSTVSSSGITYGTSKGRQRSGALTLTSGDRYFFRLVRSAGTVTQSNSFVVVDFSQ